MAASKTIDPFVSSEPSVEIDAATTRVLQERIESANQGSVVSTEEARQRMTEWLSESSITKTH